METELLARRVFRIGVEELWRCGDKWFVSVKNRTYTSTVEIPEEKVGEWVERLRRVDPSEST